MKCACVSVRFDTVQHDNLDLNGNVNIYVNACA